MGENDILGRSFLDHIGRVDLLLVNSNNSSLVSESLTGGDIESTGYDAFSGFLTTCAKGLKVENSEVTRL